MYLKPTLCCCLLGITSTIFLSLEVASANGRPNLILIVTDDQGWGDLSCHGNPVIETPHIDAMCQRSGELTRFYVSPVCSPTRACLMTGRYNYRTRVIDTFKGHSMMEPEEVTVAEILKQAGYATGIFGKWHLGDCYPMRPQDQGFDEAVVLRGGGLAQPSEPLENAKRYTNPILWRNGEQFQAHGFCTDVFFDEAQRFIQAQVEDDQSFFAYIATNAPHGPFHDVPEELYRKYKAKDLTPILLGNKNTADTVARIFAMVENIDQNVGRLFKFVDHLAITDNTLVIFMCDNGPNSRRYVGKRRGMKSEVHEGGISSPFFAHWPGHIRPGTTSDCLAAHIDVLPTLLAAAEVEAPDGVKLDGRNLLPVLTQTGSGWSDRTLVLQSHRGPIPQAGHNMTLVQSHWKLVHPTGFGRESLPPDVPYELYDLTSDAFEKHNLFTGQPTRGHHLQNTYADWFEDVSSTRPDNYAPPRIVVGTDHEPETVLTWQDWQTDGPGWGEQGKWLIRVPQPTSFQVTVILEKPAAGDATLSLGSDQHSQRVADPLQRIVFDNVRFPTGNLAVQFELRQGETVIAPYHIVLTRRR